MRVRTTSRSGADGFRSGDDRPSGAGWERGKSTIDGDVGADRTDSARIQPVTGEPGAGRLRGTGSLGFSPGLNIPEKIALRSFVATYDDTETEAALRPKPRAPFGSRRAPFFRVP
jgi:hypothetical protein